MSSVDSSITARYQEAISTLNSLQSNESILKSANATGKSPEDILRYFSLLNIKSEDINRLNIIHVAGTKGKGSTCAFTESILRQYGYRTGFYSSPHLIEVRERIKINGQMISKEKFIKYFWICYQTINEAVQKSTDLNALQMPFYFAFLTTMMFYVFIHEKIEVAVIEVGIGGERDCTNVIEKPIVCGITSLGLDHIKILGDTIDKIAWQKAGIFKKGVVAVTAPQPPEAMRVLYERAEEKQCSLMTTTPLEQYSNYPVKLSLVGEIQKINAAVALQLVFRWLDAKKVHSYDELIHSPLSEQVIQGFSTCSWPGRNQIVETDHGTYYMDGAHTVESVEQCKNWFKESIDKNKPNMIIFIFYCSGDRKADVLLQPLMDCRFDHVIFCSPMNPSPTTADKNSQGDQWRATADSSIEFQRVKSYADAFRRLQDSSGKNSLSSIDPSIHCFQTVTETFQWIKERNFSNPSVLVTGSIYLVGAVLKLLNVNNEDTE